MACTFTLADALAALAQRLYDPTSQFWTDAEKTFYFQDAMREWQALTGYWRGEFLFPTANNSRWYDLTDTTAMPATLVAHTRTDTSIIQQLEYHLLEPLTTTYPLTWTGSSQFALSDLLGAVQRRRDELLGITGCFITRQTLASAPNVQRLTLDPATIDVRRLAFLPAAGFGSPIVLRQSDQWAKQAYQSPSLPPASPRFYQMTTEPWPQLSVNAAPNVPGTWEILSVVGPAALSAAAASTLPIPDNWLWVLKWGALADLLGRESPAKDPSRAAYAQARWEEGAKLLTLAPALLALRLGDLPIRADALFSADTYRPRWQADAAAQPRRAFLAGQNLLALSPVPNAGPYSLTATVVENAPVPTAPGDCINCGRDVFDVLLDYAQHLAAFKMGGEEFSRTIPLRQHFLYEAALAVSKRNDKGQFAQALFSLAAREEELNPRTSMEEVNS